jgi:hypothetical protein
MSRGAAPAALLFVLAVVLLAPATLDGKVMSASDLALSSAPFSAGGPVGENPLQFDSGFVFEPDGLQVREALRDGRLPVWTQWLSAGRPLLAAQQSAPLFPLTWVGVVFPFWESQVWIAVLKLLLAGLGTFVLARSLGLRSGPALVGAIAFGFGTYLVDWLMHPHSNAYVLLPWLFVVADRLCRSEAVRDAAALAALIGLAWLGGHPESALLVSLATAGWVATRLRSLRGALLAAAAAVIGVALSAVMLLPLIEALREALSTSRSQPPLPLKAVGSLALPEYWGRPDRAGEIPGPVNFTERTLYAGVLPLLLAAAGLIARRPRGPQLFFAALAAVALIVSFDTGPITDVVHDLPVLDSVNVSRALVLAGFAIAMLAAFGFERWLDGTPAERRRMLIAVSALAVLPVLAVLPRIGALGEALDQLRGTSARGADGVNLAAGVRWLLFAAATVGILLAARRPRSWLAPVACAVVAVDLLWMGWGFNPAIDKAEADPPEPPPVAAMHDLTADGGGVIGVGGLEPNTASRWRLADARGHEQPSVERTARLWYALGGGATASTEAVDPSEPRTPRLLDTFGVRAVLVDRRVDVPSLRDDPIAYDGPGGFVLEHRTALPPAFVAYGWRPAASIAAGLFGVAAGTTEQARDQPVIETRDAAPAGDPPAATPARITERSDTSVTVEVDARRAGRLVLLDTFYPGWEATVDGRPADIEAANVAFRSVPVAAGRHEVRFEYRPASVRYGAIISAVALVALLVAVVAGSPRLRRRRRGPRSVGRQGAGVSRRPG